MIVDQYMATTMSLQRPTGWISFFTVGDNNQSFDYPDKIRKSPLHYLTQVIDAFTITDMIMRMKEVNFTDSDVTIAYITMPDGRILIDDYVTNNKFSVKVLESPLSSMTGFFSSWQREIYEPSEKAVRAYRQATRDRVPYKRDFLAFYISWYMNIPVITHFKGASGCFPLKYTLNDEIRTYEDSGPGVVSVELAADSINTIVVNQGTLFKNW